MFTCRRVWQFDVVVLPLCVTGCDAGSLFVTLSVRPLSKTVRFNVLKVEEATEAGAQAAKKAFRVF